MEIKYQYLQIFAEGGTTVNTTMSGIQNDDRFSGLCRNRPP